MAAGLHSFSALQIASVKDIGDAVLYLADACQVTGDVLHVDRLAHAGRW
jgi:hypothetical protein